jgi:hypothetical protein
MKLKYNGSVYFANGDPAPGVSVRIFDKDVPGKVDDDLTITAGLSDELGKFALIYEPLRYLDHDTVRIFANRDRSGEDNSQENGVQIPDLDDIYLPYLRFNYTFNSLNYTHTASLGVLQTRFFLPQYPAVEFLPSTQGFHFENRFPGYFLPFSPPAFMGSRKVPSTYGLCGGMCAAAYDFALARRLIPTSSEVPRQGSRLHRYLFQRQMDSLGGFGREVVKVAHWTSLPDDTPAGTQRRTADEWDGIRQILDQKNLAILALIYVHASNIGELTRNIFNNHQVLAHTYYVDPAGGITLNIYDPNLPGRDDVVILAEPTVVGERNTPSGVEPVIGLKSTELVAGEAYRPVRGFFAMPYKPVKPPKGV